jgi:hypothetical protein
MSSPSASFSSTTLVYKLNLLPIEEKERENQVMEIVVKKVMIKENLFFFVLN